MVFTEKKDQYIVQLRAEECLQIICEQWTMTIDLGQDFGEPSGYPFQWMYLGR